MARFLIGAEVEEVYVQAGVTVDPAIGEAGDVDTAVIMLRFANGVIGTIDNCRRASYGYDQRLEVHGSKGRLMAGNRTATTVELADATAVSGDKPLFFYLERYAEAYRAELVAFVQAVSNRQPLPVTAHDGRQAIVLAEAAVKSLQSGRPVKI
jgi:myo-inositol 2-dehydrogenase/D-chiro-inositol 1-dehydrogenase